MASRAEPNRLPLIAAGVALIGTAGVALYLLRERATEPAPAQASQPAVPAPVATEPAIRHPIEAALTATQTGPVDEPLPSLFDSDAGLRGALAAIAGLDGFEALLVPDFLIQRFVATVDNLPRRKLAPEQSPLKPVPGNFRVANDSDRVLIAPDNAARYTPYVRVLEAVDAPALVALYVRWYPLFQQAYRELGHPDAYFNDRLVDVLDHLIAAPALPADAELIRPRAVWEYADPELESLSAGRKIMLRIGPGHAAAVKAKLSEIRALLVAESP